MHVPVEICVEGVESAFAAEAGGADRVELCENLAVGGVTPSAGAMAVACERSTIPVHVLIRPRGGDFVYSDVELEIMRRDVAFAKSVGASGVVLGILQADGRVDRDKTARLIELARPLSVTFHKAFDACIEPREALETLADLGVDRILTSGSKKTAIEGVALLSELSRQAGSRLVIMAGGGISEPDVARILADGIKEIHVGSHVAVGGVTKAEKVRRLLDVVRSCDGRI